MGTYLKICRERCCCFLTSGRTTVWVFNLLAEVILGGGVIYSWFAKEDPIDALFATAALTGISLVCSVTLLLSDLMRTKLCGSSARNCLYEWAGCMASGAARFFLFLLGGSAAYALSQATAEVRELNGVWTTNAHSVLIVAALASAMAALANATVGLRLWMRGAETCCDPDANLEDLEKGMTTTDVIKSKTTTTNANTATTTIPTTSATTPESTTSSSGAAKGEEGSSAVNVKSSKSKSGEEQLAEAVVSFLIANPDVALRVLSSVATESGGDKSGVLLSSTQTQGGVAVTTNSTARAARVAFLGGGGGASTSSTAESTSGAAGVVKSDNPFLRAMGLGGGSGGGTASSSTSSSTATTSTSSVLIPGVTSTSDQADSTVPPPPLPPAGYRAGGGGGAVPNPFSAAIQSNTDVVGASSAQPSLPPGRQNRFISYAGDNPFKD